MHANRKLSTHSRRLIGSILIITLSLMVAFSGCNQRAKDSETVAVDTTNQPQTQIQSDSGSLLVAVPDSTGSPQPSRIPRAKPDTGSIGAVAMPNAVTPEQYVSNDSLERELLMAELRKAKDRLDSMEVPAEKPAGRK